MKTIARVLQVLMEKNSIQRTDLSELANLNYVRLTKHIDWFQSKSFVELMIENKKMNIKLTPVGRDFAKKLLNDEN
jgi:predicted transcriptional regulator